MKTKVTLKVFSFFLVLSFLLVPSASNAKQSFQGKGPNENETNIAPSVLIENAHVKALSSVKGGFTLGTTGGNPASNFDDNKRLIYGYPTSIRTSFSTLRINDGGIITDYRLGHEGLDPISPPTSDGTRITSIWEQSGIRVTEYLYFVTNPISGYQDTTAIEYVVQNNNSTARSAGIRIMLDVMVGSNDGAPYFIEGNGQVTQQSEWSGSNVPDYWISYESSTFDPESVQGRGQLIGGNATLPNRLVVADWPQAYNTTWDYTVNPSDPVTNDSAVIMYYNPVSLSSGQSKTFRTYYGLNATSETNQIELTGIEVTQGIQNLFNTVELIQDRKTYVRAHVQSTNEQVAAVTAELIGRRPDGSSLPGSPIKPSNIGNKINVKVNPDRGQLNDSFYFAIPSSWLNGDVEFEVRGVNQNFICKDHSNTENDCKVSSSFTESPPVEVRFVGIIFDQDNVEHRPTTTDITYVADQIFATYPIPYLDYDHPYDIKPVFFDGPPLNVLSFIRVNSMLNIARLMDGCGTNCQKYYLGVLVDQPSNAALNGMAGDIPSNVATAYVTDRYTHPHELGHSIGQRHVLCDGSEGGADLSYPYSGGQISNDTLGDNAFYGFNTNSKAIFDPSSGDLMSYCSVRWTSDWTYSQLREKIEARYQADNQKTFTTMADAIMVSGLVNTDLNSGNFEEVYTFETTTFISPPDPGSYTIRFEDDMGQEIISYPFEPTFGVDSIVGLNIENDNSLGSFALLLPKPEGFHRIILLHGAEILDWRDTSNNPPSVQVVYPNGGELISGQKLLVTWTADDADNDSLVFAVQYSRDSGINWMTLATNITSKSVEINIDKLPGTEQGLIRIIASDGLLSSLDTSNEVFSIEKHAPVAEIKSPNNGEFFVSDQLINLIGEGVDNEDGRLQGDSLSWYSNLDGFLGEGSTLVLNALDMTPGSHTITLIAQDIDGQIDESSIEMTVFQEPPTLPISLSIAPQTLQFITYLHLGQSPDRIISIRNDGDGLMTWTATDNSSWLTISSLSGTAPSNILVSVNPAGLPVGEYQGTITITAPSASNSPQIINVFMVIREPFILNLPLILK